MSPRSNPTVSDTVTQQKLVTQGLEEFLGAIHGISNLNFSSHVSVGHYPRWHHPFPKQEIYQHTGDCFREHAFFNRLYNPGI